MDRDERLLKALFEVVNTIGVNPDSFLPKRQVQYLRAMDAYSVEALEWACLEIVKVWDDPFFRMPPVAMLLNLACQAPRKLLAHGDLARTAITEATYTDELADRFFDEIMPMFGNEWGLPTTRRGTA